MLGGVETMRLARQIRALRVRRGLRQSDLAPLAGLSRTKISRIERGQLSNLTAGDLEKAATALGASLEIRVRWRGELLDRLLDEDHARLVEIIVALLRATGWDAAVEVSYSIWGERGSIDVLALHPPTGTLLVVEVKSVVPDSQAMLHALDRKTRLASQIATDRGWQARSVARLLAIGASATARRRVARLEETYAVAFPARGGQVRRWLRAPTGSISGLLFVSYGHGPRTNSALSAHERVRGPRRRLMRTG